MKQKSLINRKHALIRYSYPDTNHHSTYPNKQHHSSQLISEDLITIAQSIRQHTPDSTFVAIEAPQRQFNVPLARRAADVEAACTEERYWNGNQHRPASVARFTSVSWVPLKAILPRSL